MKNSILVSALCAALVGPVMISAHAPCARAQTVALDGYALLLQARELLTSRNGSPPMSDKLAPDDKLARERQSLTRNAVALAKGRQALQTGIVMPFPREAGMADSYVNASARELARQFAQESDVRAADGDTIGAASSALDAMQLGAQISSGPAGQWFYGAADAAIGRDALMKHAPMLDAEQTRAVITRWTLIEQMQPALDAVLREERHAAFDYVMWWIKDPLWRESVRKQGLQPEGAYGAYTHEEARVLLDLTAPQVQTNVDALFDAALTRAAQPYQAAKNAPQLQAADALTRESVFLLERLRFGYERNVVANRLDLAALRLHLAKLETGVYPETFDAGIDPFSPGLASLIYRKTGASYLLYSVGPDGKNNDGGEIETVKIDRKTGTKSVSGELTPDSTGDIVASVL